MFKLATLLLAVVTVVIAGVVAAIAFGGPTQPVPMQSVSDPFKGVDFSDVPPIQRYPARDGTQLAYRAYRPADGTAKGFVALVHGSSARSVSVHPLAKGLAQAGYVVHALDVRGHGESGERGQITFVGQLEDDLEDFMKATKPPGKKSLVGFSAGGGFVLRFAADARRGLFDNYVLLSPFLGLDASTYRPDSGGWVSVGTPRIYGLVALNRLGISSFNHLPITAYALPPEVQKFLTPRYSFALASNFRPHIDYRADIYAASQPMEVLVGEQDDQFHPDRFSSEFRSAGREVPVTIVPATGHIELTLKPEAVQAVVNSIGRLNGV